MFHSSHLFLLFATPFFCYYFDYTLFFFYNVQQVQVKCRVLFSSVEQYTKYLIIIEHPPIVCG